MPPPSSRKSQAMFLPRRIHAAAALTALFFSLGVALSRPSPAAEKSAAQKLTVLPDPYEGGPPRQMMTRYLKGLAKEALDKRLKVVDALKKPNEIEAYQKR